LLDRMDLHIEVPRVKFEQLIERSPGESSSVIRNRVTEAREIQRRRFKNENIKLNSEMQPSHVKKYCRLDEKSEELLRTAFNRLAMSARAYDRILKTARTIADLDKSKNITLNHLAEALNYRSLDRKYWWNSQ